jgi:diguanylate cyclase (GGDEF)-like protein
MSNDAVRTRIMVVDDSNLMRKAAQKMLSAEFDVVTAEDGLDAWAKLERDTTIQVVFSDLMMPRCDGYALLKMVRAAEDSGLQNIPLIVVTGADNDEAARMRALDLGATDFITKPFTTSDLIARARAHAKYQRVTRQLQEQSTLDALTGLLNKAGFMARVQQEIAFARRHGNPLTLVLLDIEDFRDIFLKHGKLIAEGLIALVAREIRSRIRPEDSAARVGLSGFALSFLAGQHDGVEAMIDRLRIEVATVAQQLDERHIPITLTGAVLTPVLQSETEASDVLEQCQDVLKEVRAKALAAKPAAKPAKAPAPKAEPKPAVPIEAAPVAPVAPVKAAPPPKAEPVSIDEYVKQIESGQTQAAVEKLPQILNRLLPLFRLLKPNQRDRLVKFLQTLGT